MMPLMLATVQTVHSIYIRKNEYISSKAHTNTHFMKSVVITLKSMLNIKNLEKAYVSETCN